MLKRKSILSLTTATLLTAVTFTGCTSSDDEKSQNNTTENTKSTVEVGTNNSSNTSGIVDNHKDSELQGSISGAIIDTAGNPVVGAKVGIGATIVETNELGQYEFNSVPTSAVTPAGCATCSQKITLSVAKAGYLSTTKEINAVNAIYSTNGYSSTTNGANETNTTGVADAGSTISNVFLDGFRIGAANTELIPLGASLEGNLRSADTGEVVPNATVIFSFVKNGKVVGTFSDDSDVEGKFKAENLPIGVEFNASVLNHSIALNSDKKTNDLDSSAGDKTADGKTTLGTIATQSIGTLNVTTSSSNDTVAPKITGVTDTISENTTPNMIVDSSKSSYKVDVDGSDNTTENDDLDSKYSLNNTANNAGDYNITLASTDELVALAKGNNGLQEVNNLKDDTLYINDAGSLEIVGDEKSRLVLDKNAKEVVINFNEPLDVEHFNANTDRVIVRYETKDENNNTIMELATPELALSSTSLTVKFSDETLVNHFGQGKAIDVNIFKNAIKDVSGNDVCSGSATISSCGSTITERFIDAKNKNQVLTVMVETFKDVNTNAGAVTATQMKSHNDEDRTDGYNAFNSVVGTDTNYDNKPDTVKNLNSTEAHSRLDQLADAIGENYVYFTGSDNTTVVDDNSTTKIKLIAGNAAKYKIEVLDSENDAISIANITDIVIAGADKIEDKGNSYEFTAKEGDEITFLVEKVVVGNVVKITPKDDLDYEGTPAVVTLKDVVAPTTVLQNSYIGGAGTIDGATAVTQFGNGGELTNNYSEGGSAGTPVLAINPGLLDNLDGKGNNILDDNSYTNGDEKLTYELYAHNTKDSDSKYYLTANSENIAGDIYDASAYSVFSNNLTRRIGVAFSESLDPAQTVPASYDGSNIAGNYTILNDITVDDSNDDLGDGIVNHNKQADLVEFETGDVIKLANDDNGKVLDFAGIKDIVGNESTQAKVQVSDMMPPFVTKAEFTYSGDLVVTFNEPISLTNPDDSEYEANLTLSKADGTNSKTILENNSNLTNAVASGEWKVSGNVLTIEDLNDTGFFTKGMWEITDPNNANELLYKYEESTYGDTAWPHGKLDFSAIKDTQGNSWANWATINQDLNTNDTDGANTNTDMEIPYFAFVDITPKFNKIVEETLGHTVSLTGGTEATANAQYTGKFATTIPAKYFFETNTSSTAQASFALSTLGTYSTTTDIQIAKVIYFTTTGGTKILNSTASIAKVEINTNNSTDITFNVDLNGTHTVNADGTAGVALDGTEKLQSITLVVGEDNNASRAKTAVIMSTNN